MSPKSFLISNLLEEFQEQGHVHRLEVNMFWCACLTENSLDHGKCFRWKWLYNAGSLSLYKYIYIIIYYSYATMIFLLQYLPLCIISIMFPKHMTQEIDRNRVNQLYPHDVPMTFAYICLLYPSSMCIPVTKWLITTI
jgi:hypothetical protein